MDDHKVGQDTEWSHGRPHKVQQDMQHLESTKMSSLTNIRQLHRNSGQPLCMDQQLRRTKKLPVFFHFCELWHSSWYLPYVCQPRTLLAIPDGTENILQ